MWTRLESATLWWRKELKRRRQKVHSRFFFLEQNNGITLSLIYVVTPYNYLLLHEVTKLA